MSFFALFSIIIVILVVINLIVMIQRSLEAQDPEDDFLDESAQNWRATRATWGERLQEADEQLAELKQAAQAKISTDEPQFLLSQDFSKMQPEVRASQVMNYLHTQRGNLVNIVCTDLRAVRGKVVTLTAYQVMLRDPQTGKVTGITYAEVEQVTPL